MEIKLNKEQIAQLRNGEDVVIKAPCKEDTLWFPRNGEKACYIDSVGDIEYGDVWSKESPCDMFRYKLGHIVKTEEEAEKHLALIEAKYIVRKRIAELNDGWIPDWNSANEKYSIILAMGNFITKMEHGVKYSPNWMYIKSGKLAEELIKELEPELRLILEE